MGEDGAENPRSLCLRTLHTHTGDKNSMSFLEHTGFLNFP